jgi:molybdopterin biosynthesis enzyme MoaB
MAEAMRATHPRGRLSRATAGTRGRALIINVVGGAPEAVEMLNAVLDVVPDALDDMGTGIVGF